MLRVTIEMVDNFFEAASGQNDGENWAKQT